VVEVQRVESEKHSPCTVVMAYGGFQLWVMAERGSSTRTEAMWVHVDDERIWFVVRPFRPELV